MTTSGFVEDGYEQVRDTFAALVADGRETGAGLSVWKDSREVVHLDGGWSDVARTRAWAPDTLAHTYSTSKPFAALTALVAVAQGAIGLDEPIAAHWSDYGTAGKEATTLRHVLTHRAGLPAFPPAAAGIDLLDDAGLRAVLAAASPETPPGSTLAEHAFTYGHLIDGVLRAASGRSLGDTFTEVVRPALGTDTHFGVPEPDLGRVAELEYGLPGGSGQFLDEVAPAYRRVGALPEGALEPARLNTDQWRRAVFGAINLHASAAGLARFYSTLTDPDGPVAGLLGSKLHAEYLAPQVCDVDGTVGISLQWTLGPLRTDAIIGLGGIGGSAGYLSLHNGHGVGYVTRRLQDHARLGALAAVLGDDARTQYPLPRG
jgi:CubicO group peptidase (beta-lactamase class C family)